MARVIYRNPKAELKMVKLLKASEFVPFEILCFILMLQNLQYSRLQHV